MVLLRRAAVAVLGGAALLTLPAVPAGAGEAAVNEPILVTTTDDVLDPDDGVLSLREAVIQASDQDGDDEIRLPSGEYVLDLGCEVVDVYPWSGDAESGDLDHAGGALTSTGDGDGVRPAIRGVVLRSSATGFWRTDPTPCWRFGTSSWSVDGQGIVGAELSSRPAH